MPCLCVTRYAVCYRVLFLCGFFFQAEDGIRDLVRSRGLGDVYKRQPDVRESAIRRDRTPEKTRWVDKQQRDQPDRQPPSLSLIHI